MSDQNPPPPSQDPYAAPSSTPYAAGASDPYGQQQPYTAPAPAKSPILSILSLVAGILGIVGAFVVFIPIVGGIMQLFLPAAAVVLGFLGKKKEPQASKGLWLTGIILGFVGIFIGLLSIGLWAWLFAVAGSTGYNTY